MLQAAKKEKLSFTSQPEDEKEELGKIPMGKIIVLLYNEVGVPHFHFSCTELSDNLQGNLGPIKEFIPSFCTCIHWNESEVDTDRQCKPLTTAFP